MRKQVIAWILGLILLTGCSLPAFQPEPTIDAVGTQVSQALTAFPTATPPASLEPTLPQVPTSTPTVELQASPTVTITLTTTPLPQPPAASPTPNQDDPQQQLGQPDRVDSFSNGQNWGLTAAGYSDDYTSVNVENGALTYRSKQPAGWLGWRLGGHEIDQAYVEAVISTLNCAGLDTYGLILKAPDYSSGQGYYLTLTCDGQYSLSATTSTGSSEVIPLTASSWIKSGPNQTNRIGIWLEGGQIKLYANGQLLQVVSNSDITGSGHIGFFIIGNQAADFGYSVTDISTWTLP